jgi:hypothetical protein
LYKGIDEAELGFTAPVLACFAGETLSFFFIDIYSFR